MSPDEIAILRIELEEIEPRIWRRVALRTASSLLALHQVIQAAMGWLDVHLWEFEIDGVVYGVPDPDGDDWEPELRRASSLKLAAVIGKGIGEFPYTYDMGDNWHHRIVVERIAPAEPGRLYPELLDGQRRGPPEDCGSVPGYYRFIKAISGPDKGKGSRQKSEALAWYGGPYDPDDIDEEQIRITLKRMARRHRQGKRPPEPA